MLEGRIPSLPYVALTAETMEAFGAAVACDGSGRYLIRGGLHYRGREWRVEGDCSSASYFFLAAALLRGRVRVENIEPASRQGDAGFLGILERLGCTVVRGEHHVEVRGGALPGGEMAFDLGGMPDIVPTLAVLCAMRPGRSLIRNVGHLRLKECDRLAALVAELGKTGIAAEVIGEDLAIAGGRPHGARIATYDDHRIAMSFAILGLAVPGIGIEDPACAGKSFPGFWRQTRTGRCPCLRKGDIMNIILTGYRCTGKSSAGRRLSARLGRPLVRYGRPDPPPDGPRWSRSSPPADGRPSATRRGP